MMGFWQCKIDVFSIVDVFFEDINEQVRGGRLAMRIGKRWSE
jgi:hypothetical protein